LRFLEVLVDTLMRARRFDPAFHGGFDQGIVNFLVRSNVVPNSCVRRNGEGIWTGRTDGNIARIDGQGRVVLRDGGPVSVVHQFDRDPGLSGHVDHSGANCAMR
ncbi:MAG: hypothetical protein ACKO39_09285, partial [Chthoniobacterales bacterium]